MCHINLAKHVYSSDFSVSLLPNKHSPNFSGLSKHIFLFLSPTSTIEAVAGYRLNYDPFYMPFPLQDAGRREDSLFAMSYFHSRVRSASGGREGCCASESLCSKLAHIPLAKEGLGIKFIIDVGQRGILLQREGGEGGRVMDNLLNNNRG